MLLSQEEQDGIRKKLTSLFDGMMKSLYRQKGANFNIEILAGEKAQEFITAHADVLDSAFQQVEMSDTMRRRLQRSNYIFSGMKAFHEMNEAFPSLLDENGNRKPFKQFLEDVRKIDQTYNEHYLRAEYNFVQASAEMAAKWEQFAQDGDRYYLQYRTVGDSKVRPEHAAMHGITLPMSDPFWEDFYPPNGWGCRCSVAQVRKSKHPVTDSAEAIALGEIATGRDTKGIFHFNAGKEQKTFPDYNPYTVRKCRDCDIAKGDLKLAFIPDDEVCAACKFIRTCTNHKFSEPFRNYRKETVDSAHQIDGASYSNLQTGVYYQTKKSLKRGLSHAYNIEEVSLFAEIELYIPELTFIRRSELGEGKDMSDPKNIANIQKKVHRGVTGYNIYEAVIFDQPWELKTEVYKDRAETLYAAMKKG